LQPLGAGGVAARDGEASECGCTRPPRRAGTGGGPQPWISRQRRVSSTGGASRTLFLRSRLAAFPCFPPCGGSRVGVGVWFRRCRGCSVCPWEGCSCVSALQRFAEGGWSLPCGDVGVSRLLQRRERRHSVPGPQRGRGGALPSVAPPPQHHHSQGPHTWHSPSPSETRRAE